MVRGVRHVPRKRKPIPKEAKRKKSPGWPGWKFFDLLPTDDGNVKISPGTGYDHAVSGVSGSVTLRCCLNHFWQTFVHGQKTDAETTLACIEHIVKLVRRQNSQRICNNSHTTETLRQMVAAVYKTMVKPVKAVLATNTMIGSMVTVLPFVDSKTKASITNVMLSRGRREILTGKMSLDDLMDGMTPDNMEEFVLGFVGDMDSIHDLCKLAPRGKVEVGEGSLTEADAQAAQQAWGEDFAALLFLQPEDGAIRALAKRVLNGLRKVDQAAIREFVAKDDGYVDVRSTVSGIARYVFEEISRSRRCYAIPTDETCPAAFSKLRNARKATKPTRTKGKAKKGKRDKKRKSRGDVGGKRDKKRKSRGDVGKGTKAKQQVDVVDCDGKDIADRGTTLETRAKLQVEDDLLMYRCEKEADEVIGGGAGLFKANQPVAICIQSQEKADRVARAAELLKTTAWTKSPDFYQIVQPTVRLRTFAGRKDESLVANVYHLKHGDKVFKYPVRTPFCVNDFKKDLARCGCSAPSDSHFMALSAEFEKQGGTAPLLCINPATA